MTGTKADFLAERCAAADISFLRIDYRGHGQSSGTFTDGTIGAWFEDTCTVFDRLTEGAQIVVGSSMGGWLACLLAVGRAARVHALIGVAAGPDFTEDLVLPHLTEPQKERLEKDGVIYFKAPPPAQPMPITKRLLVEAKAHLVLDKPLSILCPVRLLQGMEDEDIPWQHALRVAAAIGQGDVQVTLVKDGGHRLSRPQDLALLWRTVEEFV
ncbi:MAG: alpha/beta hydrolase [Pseudomonadota bacterium]|nr:alpha/beta hydrolase [Pseudomonadota bacterium]